MIPKKCILKRSKKFFVCSSPTLRSKWDQLLGGDTMYVVRAAVFVNNHQNSKKPIFKVTLKAHWPQKWTQHPKIPLFRPQEHQNPLSKSKVTFLVIFGQFLRFHVKIEPFIGFWCSWGLNRGILGCWVHFWGQSAFKVTLNMGFLLFWWLITKTAALTTYIVSPPKSWSHFDRRVGLERTKFFFDLLRIHFLGITIFLWDYLGQ